MERLTQRWLDPLRWNRVPRNMVPSFVLCLFVVYLSNSITVAVVVLAYWMGVGIWLLRERTKQSERSPNVGVPPRPIPGVEHIAQPPVARTSIPIGEIHEAHYRAREELAFIEAFLAGVRVADGWERMRDICDRNLTIT